MIRKRKYFELPLAPADILAEFDCTYERKRLDLPRYQGSIKCMERETSSINTEAKCSTVISYQFTVY